jgi:peptidyl-tRNA hydrolase
MEHGFATPLTEHIDPERSSTSIATRSLREAWPVTVRLVKVKPTNFMNQAGTLVVAVTVT